MSVGFLGAAGIPGPVAALRFSAIGARAGFDIDWGVLADDGPPDNRFVAAQLRIASPSSSARTREPRSRARRSATPAE